MLFLIVACERPGPWLTAEPQPAAEQRVSVSPGIIDFGDVSLSTVGSGESSLEITNLGTDVVSITGHDEPVGDERFRIDAEPIEAIEAGQSRSFVVHFFPQTNESASAQLRIEPGGELVQLRGNGLAPVVGIGAAEVPATVLGCVGEGQATVTNTGSEALEITDVRLDGPDFQLTGWQSTVAPGGTMNVEFSFMPLGGGQRGATLSIDSNDPQTPQLAMNFGALGYEGGVVEESFRYSPTAPTDVLFVVEGGSLAGNDVLGPALDAYVETIKNGNVDFQLAAVASSDPCPPGSPAWATPSNTTLATINGLSRAFSESGGAWDHDLLGLASAALDQDYAGGCLDGFRREGANLDVVIVGRSTPQVDVSLAASKIANTLGANESFRLSAMVPYAGSCGTEGAAYAAATVDYGGVAADWCDDDWTTAFSRFADLPNSDTAVRYLLADVPVEQSISVTVEGNVWTFWTFDANTNTIVFDNARTPALGAQVTLRYVSAVSCTP